MATLVAVCLLFAQIATAAYACPQLTKLTSSMAGGDMALVVMVDCDSMPVSQMDKEQPNLCKAHCEVGQQSPESKGGADMQLPALGVLWSLIWVLQPALETAGHAVSVAHVAARPPGSPPLYLVHQVFRL